MGVRNRNVTRLQTRPSTTVAYHPCTALTHHILWLSSALSAKYAVLIHYATVVLALRRPWRLPLRCWSGGGVGSARSAWRVSPLVPNSWIMHPRGERISEKPSGRGC